MRCSPDKYVVWIVHKRCVLHERRESKWIAIIAMRSSRLSAAWPVPLLKNVENPKKRRMEERVWHRSSVMMMREECSQNGERESEVTRGPHGLPRAILLALPSSSFHVIPLLIELQIERKNKCTEAVRNGWVHLQGYNPLWLFILKGILKLKSFNPRKNRSCLLGRKGLKQANVYLYWRQPIK